LDLEKRKFLCNRIVCGYTVCWFMDEEIFVHDPSSFEIYRADKYYEEIYNRLLEQGIPSEERMLAMLTEKGLWNKTKEKQIIDLNDNLHKLRKQLPLLTFRSAEKKQVEAYISVTEEKIKNLENIKNSNFFHTAEYLANIEKFKYLLFFLAKKPCGKRIWFDMTEFNQIENSKLNYLIASSFFNKDINEKSIREVARTEPWRSIWLGAVKVGNLFSKPLTEITEYQKMLVTWSIVYDNVYESMDCPSDDVIQNDDLLDQWFTENSEKRKKEKGQSNSLGISNSKIANAQEIGIVVDSLEDAQNVYNLNSNNTIAELKRDYEVLNKKGELTAGNLPSVRKQLKMQANELNKQGIKNRHG